MKRIPAISLLFITNCLLYNEGFSQKKPLDHSVYDSWQHIGERMISNDGKWVVYTIDPQEGDNELVIQSADAGYRKTIARGYSAVITEDSRYVIFKIKPVFKETRDARIKKKKTEDFPKDSFAIVELGKDNVWKTARVKSFKAPADSYGWVGYQLEKMPEPPARRPAGGDNSKRVTDSLNRVIDSLNAVIRSMPVEKKKKNKNKDEDFTEEEETDNRQSEIENGKDAEGDETPGANADAGSDLVVRDLSNGQEKTYPNVLEYFFSKKGDKLLFEQAKNPKDSMSKPQVILVDLKSGSSKVLIRGGNDFKNFTFNDDGSQLAFVAERDSKPKDLQKYYKLWYYAKGLDTAVMVADRYSVGIPIGSSVSEFGNISFSRSGRRLFFGTAPVVTPKDTTMIDIDVPKVDIWHYKDDYLQTVQLYPNRLRAEQQQNFLAVYDIGQKTLKQLGSRQVPQVIQTNEGDGDLFVGVSDFGKRVESQWRGNTLKDIYAIDVNTGDKKLVKQNLAGQTYPSSTGKFIMWYDRKAKNYFAWDGAKTRNISEKLKLPLWNEDFDSPDDPNNYGVMGWMENDVAVLVYDRYDIWALDPTGEYKPQVFSKSMGRATKTTYRYVQLDPEKRFFKSTDAVLLRSANQVSKEGGLAVMGMDPERFYVANKSSFENFQLGTIQGQNKEYDHLIYTKENFTSSPDLYVASFSGTSPAVINIQVNETKLSAINPQQANYNWGTAELLKWKAYNGKEATGVVYKPENFDPKKKYPMIVYFYEKLSQDLYDYKEPAPIRSAINVPFFVSRGYIIFIPDIEYKVGHPGQSAYDYIVSGTRALVKKGYVDSTNMALQGHSWGGYQAAQLATMTKLYKAIWAGAPVANMTSAYGGIRWESGVSRQFQYERTQSRIGGTLWEKLPLYMENSPLFHLDKVTAPMVIMANDADGAVPWYQGIEMFTALRRLNKKVWMFNYNGQGHGLTQRQDMRDYQIRMQQFFDWILKGDRPARWITEGVPAVNKGKDLGLDY